LVSDVFIPVTAACGIRNIADVEKLFNSGADKVIVNSALFDNANLVTEIDERYGSQSIIALVDYNIVNGEPALLIMAQNNWIYAILIIAQFKSGWGLS
jgi:cyclase